MNWFDPSTGETTVYNLGDIAWTLASTALVWLMIPGLGFFYSGLLRRKNALSMIFTSMISIGVVSFQVRRLCSSSMNYKFNRGYASLYQWFFWGYSLAFSDTASKFIGDLRAWHQLSISVKLLITFLHIGYFGLKGVLEQPSVGSTRIPAIVFCVYQLMFAAIT